MQLHRMHNPTTYDENHAKKWPICDDVGLRSPVVHKPFQTKSATSIVAGVGGGGRSGGRSGRSIRRICGTLAGGVIHTAATVVVVAVGAISIIIAYTIPTCSRICNRIDTAVVVVFAAVKLQ